LGKVIKVPLDEKTVHDLTTQFECLDEKEYNSQSPIPSTICPGYQWADAKPKCSGCKSASGEKILQVSICLYKLRMSSRKAGTGT
jgi:hypothetical protein